MSDPLFDPLAEVLAEFGEAAPPSAPIVLPPVTAKPALPPPPVTPPTPPAPPVRPTFTVPELNAPDRVPGPPAATPAPRVVPDGPPPRPLQSGPTPTAADLADLRDGLAGMRTDLRQVPEQVGQAIAGTVLHSVSVALSDVRRPLESMGLITEQLGAVLGRLDAVAGLREQLTRLDGVPEAIESSRAQINRELGGLASDLAALLTRVTGIDGKIADVSASAASAEQGVRDAIHDEVGKTVRDQLRDLVRDGVHDGVSGTLDENMQARVIEAVEAAQGEVEARIRAHVDDAVMNLAEVLMRHQATLVRDAAKIRAKANITAPATKAAKATKATKRAAPAKPKPSVLPEEPEVEDDEGNEIDALITRMPAAESLADAISNAVRRAGLEIASDEPRYHVPPPAPDAPGVEDVIASWSSSQDGPEEPLPRPRRRLFGRDRG